MEMGGGSKYYLRPKGKGLKLHLGCGDYWFEGYVNIDFNVYGGTDMLWDMRKGLPFQDHTVEIIELYEVLEHLNREEVHSLLEEFKRLLIEGGKVQLSVPDMDGLIEKYATDKSRSIEMIYGLVDHPHHKWGYTKETMKKLFEDHGFKNIIVEQGSVPERKDEPQLFLEAIV